MAIPSTDRDTCKAVESPCIRLCTLDDDDVCLGCFRNIIEICAWASAGDDKRRHILDLTVARRRDREQRG